jgi:hypothetical protein
LGFSRELTAKLPPYFHHGKEKQVVFVQLWPADCTSWPIQIWWWSDSLGIPERSKIERGKRGEFSDVLTSGRVLTVYIRIKVHMDLQADKSPVVVKGPFFPRVVNPRYQIRRTMCNTRILSSKARKAILWRTKLHLI